jgi:O-antigen ligase
MHYVLAALLAFGILTLWIPAEWPVAVFQIGVFALSGWAVCRSHRQPPIFAYPLLPLAAAVAVGVLQLATGRTVYAFDTKQSLVRWLTFLCVFYVATTALRDERRLHWFQGAMLWFGSAVALVATLQTFTADGQIFWLFRVPYSDVAMGPILSHNHYAAFIEVLLPLALYQALRRTDWPFLYAGMAATMYASVIACTSRAGTILSTAAVVVVISVMYLSGMVKGRQAGAVLLRIASLLVLFTIVVGWQAVWNRLLQPDPMVFRRELNISSLHMIAAQPWLGTGLGTWPVVYPKYAIVDAGLFANQAHCDWLQWAAEGGIPLALLMVLLFVWAIRSTFRSFRRPSPHHGRSFRCLWGLGIVSVFLHACVDYPFSRPALGSWFIVMLAMLAAGNALAAPNRYASDEPVEGNE